jgi:hypothetical protein
MGRRGWEGRGLEQAGTGEAETWIGTERQARTGIGENGAFNGTDWIGRRGEERMGQAWLAGVRMGTAGLTFREEKRINKKAGCGHRLEQRLWRVFFFLTLPVFFCLLTSLATVFEESKGSWFSKRGSD